MGTVPSRRSRENHSLQSSMVPMADERITLTIPSITDIVLGATSPKALTTAASGFAVAGLVGYALARHMYVRGVRRQRVTGKMYIVVARASATDGSVRTCAAGCAACQWMAAGLARLANDASTRGIEVEHATLDTFPSYNLMNGASLITFVVDNVHKTEPSELASSDPLLTSGGSLDSNPFFQWLRFEAATRLGEAAYQGYQSNIVYDAAGYRRTSITRSKYAVVQIDALTAATQPHESCQALFYNACELSTYLDDFGSFCALPPTRTLAHDAHDPMHCTVGAPPANGSGDVYWSFDQWRGHLWDRVDKILRLPGQMSKCGESDCLGPLHVWDWLQSCRCCTSWEIEKMRRRPSPLRLNSLQFIRWMLTSSEGRRQVYRKVTYITQQRWDGWVRSFYHCALCAVTRFSMVVAAPAVLYVAHAPDVTRLSRATHTAKWIAASAACITACVALKNSVSSWGPVANDTSMMHTSSQKSLTSQAESPTATPPSTMAGESAVAVDSMSGVGVVPSTIYTPFRCDITDSTLETLVLNADYYDHGHGDGSGSVGDGHDLQSTMLVVNHGFGFYPDGPPLPPSRQYSSELVLRDMSGVPCVCVTDPGTRFTAYYSVGILDQCASDEEKASAKDCGEELLRILPTLSSGLQLSQQIVDGMSQTSRRALLRAGVLVSSDWCDLQVSQRAATVSRQYDELTTRGWTVVENIIPPLFMAAIRRFMRRILAVAVPDGGMGPGLATVPGSRQFAWNDEIAGRFLNQWLTEHVESIAREPLVHPGLALTLWIMEGKGFVMHTDSTPPFDLTLDLCVDHQGEHPRPVNFVVRRASGGVTHERLCLNPGQSVLFRGAEAPHFGGDMPSGRHTVTLSTWSYVRD